MSATMGSMFGVECANCEADADVDVLVLDATTGEVVRDLYACDACEASMDVPSGFAVTAESV